MKDKSQLIIPSDRLYTKEHTWIKPDGEYFLVGISDFAQDQLGEIVYLDLPNIGAKYSKMQSFGTVESLKSVNELYIPICAEIIEINSLLEDSPTLINASPNEKAWIVKIKAEDQNDYLTCLSHSAYLDLL